MKTLSRMPQPLKEMGTVCTRVQSGTIRKHGRRAGAGCAGRGRPCSSRRRRAPAGRRWRAKASQTAPSCVAVDVHRRLARSRSARAPSGSVPRPDQRHRAGARCRAGRRRRRGRRRREPEADEHRPGRPPGGAPRSRRARRPASARSVEGAEAEDAVDRHHGERRRGGAGEPRAVADADDVAADVAGQEVVEEGGDEVGRREVAQAGREALGLEQQPPAPGRDARACPRRAPPPAEAGARRPPRTRRWSASRSVVENR